MAVRVEVEEGEPLAGALKRLRHLLHEEGGHPICHAKWHKRRFDRYEKPSILRRRRRWVAIEKRIRGWEAGPRDLSWSDWFFTFELRPRRLWPPPSVAPDRIRWPKARRRDSTGLGRQSDR
jgi:ribosomal protein S21